MTLQEPSRLRRLLRRCVRFRLSTLFIVVTLLAFGLGIFGVRWYRDWRETRAVEALRAAGGQVVTRSDGSAQRVWLGGESFSDAHLADTVPHLRSLRTLEEIDIVDAPVTDKGLEHLQRLPQVRLLYVHETQATESGIAKLSQTLPDVEIRRERPHPVASRLAARTIYPSAIISAAFSPDETWLVTGSGDGSLRWWHTRDGQLIESTHAHGDWVFAAAFSPDGKLLATGGGDNLIALWNVDTRRIKDRLAGHTDDVHSLAFDPTGTRLYSAGDDRVVRVWDVASRREIDRLEGHRRAIPAVAISPDGRSLASASRDGTVRLWNVAGSPRKLHRILADHRRDAVAVAFSPDGRRLASAGYDRKIRLWDVASGQQQQFLAGHDDWVFTVAFNHDGSRLASGARDGTVRIWDLSSGIASDVLRGQSEVSLVRFSPDGRRLLSTGADGTIFLRDAATARLTRVLRTRFGDRDLTLPIFACAAD